ncbi:cobyrinate a,c-diamide synthase [Chengkuizengella axinellae]|uniref:Cobyrinate a,c-diamide synthase n=1 Tax=Chengkuizengella axinellae TaxID=3064388 RepID=A0ABT9IXT2_9BACL|nr:cobyrinate a,c-diamide synthase [Chengkuizengella sp. 2205SS18-9]MDP5274181.1 cobyrinate a,c-diamide synthase [Chengkuizengella sp. 2205SS18-9]
MNTQKRIVIAGTGSGVGKTTTTIGLMALLKRRGLTVQGFKCGPDYIDPTYHTVVTGRISRNLDSWMTSENTVKEIFNRGSKGADISIIEGVMGFYDGKNPKTNTGSTAEISLLTKSPVILVVNCQSMARSAAAIVKGFQSLDEKVNIVGVIANKVGSEGHYKLVKIAIEQECGIPVVGYLKREDHINIPERHLGLIPSIGRGELDSFFNSLADLIEQSIDVDYLLELAEAPVVDVLPELFKESPTNSIQKSTSIAVAKDAAFHFYYPENLELLKANGADIVYFSPLAGEEVPPEVQGLYIGGGFPEEFAEQLGENVTVKKSIKNVIEAGIPTLAECGGFMYLTEEIETTEGTKHPMIGLIPGKVKMQKKLAALGYREITGSQGNFLLDTQMNARGHEFHYSTYETELPIDHAYVTKGMRGTKKEGYLNANLVAGYTHFHFASNPDLVKRWIEKCVQFKLEI